MGCRVSLHGNPKGIAIIQPGVAAQRLRRVKNTQSIINPEWVASRGATTRDFISE
jgi:hypothetical protein